jgi:glucose-1-phosphate cytidylyltransferase
MKVKRYLEDEEMFLANYSDGLSNLHLPDQIDFLIKSGKTACFLCAKPSQSFHVIKLGEDHLVKEIKYVRESDLIINCGFFIFKKEIFDVIKEGEELVDAPFSRLMERDELIGYRYDRFWCMDTFKEHQELNDRCNNGDAPWQVWKNLEAG